MAAPSVCWGLGGRGLATLPPGPELAAETRLRTVVFRASRALSSSPDGSRGRAECRGEPCRVAQGHGPVTPLAVRRARLGGSSHPQCGQGGITAGGDTAAI